MAILVDTNVLITIERRHLGLESLQRLVPDQPLHIAAITASELLTGINRANTPIRRQQRQAYVDALVQLLPVVPFDLAVADAHARIWAELTQRGTLIGPYDMLIAATARALDLVVLTDNVSEFRRVPDLIVLQPEWPK